MIFIAMAVWAAAVGLGAEPYALSEAVMGHWPIFLVFMTIATVGDIRRALGE